HVEVEVVLARDPRARPDLVLTLGAGLGPGLVHRRVVPRADPQLLPGQSLHRAGPRPRPRPARSAPHLAADLGRTILARRRDGRPFPFVRRLARSHAVEVTLELLVVPLVRLIVHERPPVICPRGNADAQSNSSALPAAPRPR